MIGNEYTPVRFQPVYCSDKQLEKAGSGENDDIPVHRSLYSRTVHSESGERVTAESEGREGKLMLLHAALQAVRGPL